MSGADKDLGMQKPIARRDLLHGFAMGSAVWGTSGLASELRAAGVPLFAELTHSPYPPALTGMRGSHKGSFETAHQVSQGATFTAPSQQTDQTYDLIVVGGGISGLAAAHFYRQKAGADARILILDNHDDFGGHAKRNEFTHKGHLLIGYGGSQSIDGPGSYSRQAKRLLKDIGVDVSKFYDAFDQGFYDSFSMHQGLYFDKKTYGKDTLIPGGPGVQFMSGSAVETSAPSYNWVDDLPYSKKTRREIKILYTDKTDHLKGRSVREKIRFLQKTSYNDYLVTHLHMDPESLDFFQKGPHAFWGIGTDALSAYECHLMGFPGFQGLALKDEEELYFGPDSEPYIFHFPDGNASLARLLVRKLVPDAAPGVTMEDVVTARFDYTRLDDPASPVRIRLNSTAVSVAHVGYPQQTEGVEVVYVTNSKASRVRGAHAVLACYNMMIPYIFSELPEAQRDALSYNVKTPLVYTNVLLRNWRAFQSLKIASAYCPGSYHSRVALDFPVNLGDYAHATDPANPIVLHMVHVPTVPNLGLTAREQARAGRGQLLTTPFETFEREIRTHLNGMLGGGGFDAARDIEAITVNRWPHGYAYEYNTLFDPEWPPGAAPHELARKPFGRVTIANSDAGASAYADSAIDQAYRAVEEITG